MKGDFGFFNGGISVVFVLVFFGFVGCGNGLGSMSTIAASYGNGSATVCGILSGGQRGIQCVQNGQNVMVVPNVSFVGVSGGDGFFCGLRRGGQILLCWNTDSGLSGLKPKRISKDVGLKEIVVGEKHVCGVVNGTGFVSCWRDEAQGKNESFDSISAGREFTCGIRTGDRRVRCWGLNGTEILSLRGPQVRMRMVVAGGRNVCGIKDDGFVQCWNGSGTVVDSVPTEQLSAVALGDEHGCGIRQENKTVVCWGDSNLGYSGTLSFEAIVAGDNYTCGLVTANFSVLCWGGRGFESGRVLSLPQVLPRPCGSSRCSCGEYPNSDNLCAAESEYICFPCSPMASAPAPVFPPTGGEEVVVVKRGLTRGLLVLLILGSIGGLIGAATVTWCLWRGYYARQRRVHNSVQPTVAPLHSASLRRQTSRAFRRQRSGTSSNRSKRAEEFNLAELETATVGFAVSNIIGAGSFGTVYRGKLPDGREVAIKRGDVAVAKKFQEKEAAFQSELAFLSRLHHKHLVSLIGYCEEGEERMLVYEYMPNGALYDHLHKHTASPLFDSWTDRVKVVLDAARGVEYLHTYAVPPIIHRDIKSSNILLDATWTARVSDFGLSLLGPEEQGGHLSMTAAGTVGYMDPEYYRLHHLTTKTDVYGFGVVLLEVLTGQRAIFKPPAASPISVVDYAVPRILSDELHQILDSRVRPPLSHEIEAVELVAYTAVNCVHLEGKDRPSMTDIVANLERAVAICMQVPISRSTSLAFSSPQ